MKRKFTHLIFVAISFSLASPFVAGDDHDSGNRGLPARIKLLQQQVEQNNADIQNNAANIQRNSDKSAANMADIQNNAANIADNFSQIQNNRGDIIDLDARVSGLESAPPGGGDDGTRRFVDVDCTTNPFALVSPPINGYFPDNTTYNIVGICNGPLYITEDGVRFVGAAAGATILLPAGIPNAADGAVFADGAQDLRIQNLIIDASAWNSGANQGVESAGIYARNAFVRVIDSDIIGGEYGINPFRGALVRLQGEVNITEFLNVGISAGDHSLVTTRGQVNISSSVTEGSFMTGIELYRGGNMDFRRGVTVNLPEPIGNLFPQGITASDNSHLRIRQSGNVNIKGSAIISSNSTLSMQGGTLQDSLALFRGASASLFNTTLEGNLELSRGASAELFNVNQTGNNNIFTSNSSMQAFNSTVANSNVMEGSVARIIGGELDGAIAQINGVLFVQQGVSVTNSISAPKPSFVEISDSNMNGFPLVFCDEDTTFFDASVTNPIDTCP